MAEIIGGCLCGHARYSANADPVFVGVCDLQELSKTDRNGFFGPCWNSEIGNVDSRTN
jgi:hypothetical protein